MAAYLVPRMLEHTPVGLHRIEQQRVFKLWDGLTIAQILSEVGIVSPGTNDGFVSVELS